MLKNLMKYLKAKKNKKSDIEDAEAENNEKAEGKKEEKKKPISTTRVTGDTRATMQINNRCDLRGLMVDEAIIVLDRFLDDLLRSGQWTIEQSLLSCKCHFSRTKLGHKRDHHTGQQT